MKRILLILISIIALAGCTDTTQDFDIKGEAINDFSLSAPNNNRLLVLNSGAQNTNFKFSWTESKPGISKPVTYTFEIFRNEQTLGVPIYTSPSANSGQATELTLTYLQIDNLLAVATFANGATANLKWRVRATNGDMEKTSQIYNITIKRFSDGIVPFNLLNPINQGVVSLDSVFFTNVEYKSVKFSWQTITTINSTQAPAVKVLIDTETGNFSNPIMSIDAAPSATFVTIPKKTLFEKIVDAGYRLNKVKWTVRASLNELELLAPEHRIVIDTVKYRKIHVFGSSTIFGPNAMNAYPMYQVGTTKLFVANTYVAEGNIFFSPIQNLGLALGVNSSTNVLEIDGPSAPNTNPNRMTLITVNMDTKIVTVAPTVLGLIGPATGSSINQTNLPQIAPFIWQGNVNLIGNSWFYIRLNNSWNYAYSQVNGKMRFGRSGSDQFRTDGLTTGTYRVTVNLTHGNYSYSINAI